MANIIDFGNSIPFRLRNMKYPIVTKIKKYTINLSHYLISLDTYIRP